MNRRLPHSYVNRGKRNSSGWLFCPFSRFSRHSRSPIIRLSTTNWIWATSATLCHRSYSMGTGQCNTYDVFIFIYRSVCGGFIHIHTTRTSSSFNSHLLLIYWIVKWIESRLLKSDIDIVFRCTHPRCVRIKSIYNCNCKLIGTMPISARINR